MVSIKVISNLKFGRLGKIGGIIHYKRKLGERVYVEARKRGGLFYTEFETTRGLSTHNQNREMLEHK